MTPHTTTQTDMGLYNEKEGDENNQTKLISNYFFDCNGEITTNFKMKRCIEKKQYKYLGIQLRKNCSQSFTRYL